MAKDYLSEFHGRFYHPIPPQADNDELADKGDRLILKHVICQEPKIFVAPKGTLYAGWVIGVMED